MRRRWDALGDAGSHLSRTRDPSFTGSAERWLLHRGLRYSLGLRAVVVGASSLVSLVLDPPRHEAAGVVVWLGFALWNACYAWLQLRDGAFRRWAGVLDVTVMCAVCLSQAWTVSPASQGLGAGPNWVLVAVQIVLVTYPWQIGSGLLSVAALTITAAYLAGSAVPNPGGWFSAGPAQVWTVAEAALSWGLYRFVRRGARAADRVIERGERLRRAASVAAARRADEREYLAALHDTASATLLMIGAGVVAGRERWLAGQAARDLDVISRPGARPAGAADLLDLLHEVARHTPLRIRWHGVTSLRLPAATAALLSRGAREALTNVARHAGTDSADVHVHLDDGTVAVEISDDGRGFALERVPDRHYGVTRSLVERMRRSGGDALVRSRPGEGTRVRLSLPLSTSDFELAGNDAGIITTMYQEGLRRAVVVLSLVVLLALDLPKLLTGQAAYRPAWPQAVVWGGLLLVTAGVGVATWRGRPLGRWRWPLVAAVFVLSAVATAVVRPEYLLGPAHWSEGDTGWQIALLLLDSPAAVFAGVLVAGYAMTFTQAAFAGQAAIPVVGVVNATWVVLSFQLAIGMIALVLRDLAVSAARAARADEQLATSEAVARQLHRDHARRWSALAATAEPLLAGLASGALDPGDEAVRRSCAVEAARMRRLLDENATEPDSLLHDLRSCIELAERNGVSVSFAECGTLPVLPASVRRRLTEPAIAVLAASEGHVRLTVSGPAAADESVTVSVVTDRPPHALPIADQDGVRTSVLRHDDRLWIKTTWRRA